MAKQTTTPKSKKTPVGPKFKKNEFAMVKGQKEPCQIVEVDEKAKAYKLYVKNETFTLEISNWIKENQLKPVPKEA